jgi:hypothetical protein
MVKIAQAYMHVNYYTSPTKEPLPSTKHPPEVVQKELFPMYKPHYFYSSYS